MLSAKDEPTVVGSHAVRVNPAWRLRRRRTQAGQSVIVAIIVLFLLMFLGGVFVALIANNLRNTRRGIQISAADKFSEAGIRYLDQQLMNSPEGADWRPVAGCPAGTLPCTAVSINDPDYFWLKPLTYNTNTKQWEGGYTRIDFGGPTPSQTNLGGRALVRISYRPYRIVGPGESAGDQLQGDYWEDLNGDGIATANEIVDATTADRTRRYMKLESVGRVGVIDPMDPTTYQNTEGLGLRRELVAYKALGLTENLRFITDKDKRRSTATLGAPFPVRDRPIQEAGDPASNYLFGGYKFDANGNLVVAQPQDTAAIVNRPIYSVYQGGIRSNTDLTFYGMNYLALDPRRGDELEVAGSIGLNGVQPSATAPAPTDPTKVYVTSAPTISVSALGGTAAADTGTVLPSTSPSFSTLTELVSDNPQGSDTQGVPDAGGNNNLRAAQRLEPPLMDTPIGDNGLTRYRSLTRDAPPLPISQTGNDSPANPTTTTGHNIAVGIARQNAGAFGWGTNLYIPNGIDLPVFGDTASASNVTSQRSEWLNPTQGSTTEANWKTDGIYVPPAVTITLTPRWFSMTQSAEAGSRNRSYLRRPNDGAPIDPSVAGGTPTEYRYTYDSTGPLLTVPTMGIDDTASNVNASAYKFAGYPATENGPDGIKGTADDTPYYQGDLVIYAEGNVRIKGVAGGYDPESKTSFVRHITVVSNGTIYVEGNLLRDNISPALAAANAGASAAKGKSTIALLAKNYIAVNTTQFLATNVYPNVTQVSDTNSGDNQYVMDLKAADSNFPFSIMLGPTNAFDGNGLPIVTNVYNGGANDLNSTPPYLSDTVATDPKLSLLMRGTPDVGGASAVAMSINSFLDTNNLVQQNTFINWNSSVTAPPNAAESFVMPSPRFRDSIFALNANPAPTAALPDFLFPKNGYPYINATTGTEATIPAVGISNTMNLAYDAGGAGSGSVPFELNRLGVVPLDVRIEALMYAQEGSFFIIPGSWFNPNPNDTLAQFYQSGHRSDENGGSSANLNVDPAFPFYNEPLDVRITMFGAISENLPAEIGDQGAWLEKWGWVPRYYGSTGIDALPSNSNAVPAQGTKLSTFHGDQNGTSFGDGVGNGVQYIYDPRLAAPYDAGGTPLRANPNFAGLPATQQEPLPPMPRLPVAPGLLFYGERPLD